jgi:hypothetical protein
MRGSDGGRSARHTCAARIDAGLKGRRTRFLSRKRRFSVFISQEVTNLSLQQGQAATVSRKRLKKWRRLAGMHLCRLMMRIRDKVPALRALIPATHKANTTFTPKRLPIGVIMQVWHPELVVVYKDLRYTELKRVGI